MFEATLRNRSQPKLGALAVTFPIPEERYDWENFKKERIYAIHTQEFREAQYDNGNSQEDKSPLFKKFLSAISRWDNYAASTSTGWIEDIIDFGGADRIDLTEDTSPNFLGGAMRVHDFMAASLDELRQYSEEPQLGGM